MPGTSRRSLPAARETIEELRLALIDFAQWYNTQWLVARHGYMTPAQVRAEQQQPGALAA